jgi:uncharacterized FlgJ-related protein
MHFEIAFVVLFTIATAVAIAARRFKVPYTVALVLAGIVLGAAHAFEAPHLTKEILFAVVLHYETHLATMQAAHAALTELEDMDKKRTAHADIIESLRGEYHQRIEHAEQSLRDLHMEKSQLRAEEESRARRQLLIIEKDRVLRAFRHGVIGQDAYDRLLTRIDESLEALDEHEVPKEPAS